MNTHTFSLLPALLLSISATAITIPSTKDASGFPFLIPSVQKLAKAPGAFTLPQHLAVTAPADAANELALLSSHISTRHPGRDAVPAAPNAAAPCALVITDQDVPASDQGYALAVTPQAITVRARTRQGLYYGVQTLGNLIANADSDALPCCTVSDWPDLPIRGIFLDIRWLKNEDAPNFAKVFSMLGALKLNYIELDCGANLPFRDSPFTNRKFTLTQQNLDLIIAAARDNYVEIVPHLQVISHNQWLRDHPKYLTDISAKGEDKTRKYNSTWNQCTCPAKPLAREMTDFAIRETIRLFHKPRYFHICLDELELCNWKQCDTCKQPHTIDQIVNEVKHTVDLIQSLGVTPMVYQDSLTPERSNNSVLAQPLLDIMPRNAAISFWDYAIAPKANQFRRFQNDGFKDILGVSFCYRLPNTMTLPLMIKQQGGQGSVLTYWGWIGKLFLDTAQNNANAAASTIVNAEYSWRAHQDYTYASMPFDPAYQLRRTLSIQPCPLRRPGDAIAPLPFAQFCNSRLGSDFNFFRLTPELTARLVGEAAATPEHFRLLATPDHGLAALVLGGGNDAYSRTPVTIPVNAKVSGLSFLMTAGLPDNPDAFGYRQSRFSPTIASLAITYADGTTKNIPLRYRLHFNNWNSEASGAESRFVLRGNDAADSTFSLYAYDWDNATPDLPVKSITISPVEKHGVPLALFAISACRPDSPFPADTALPANLAQNNGNSKNNLDNPTLISHFNETGIAGYNVEVQGKFGPLKPSWRLIDDPTAPVPGKVLEIIVPPQAPDVKGRSRAILDIPVKPNTPLKALVADYRVIGECHANAHNGFYRTNHDMSKYEVCYGCIVSPDESWQHIVVPETRMPAEFDAPLTPDEYTTVRFSIWFDGNTKPIRFLINCIAYYDFCDKWMQPLLKDKIK